MAILPVKVETTKKASWSTRSYVKVTNKSFITIWQMASCLEDVVDTINSAPGCDYTRGGLKSKATFMRNAYGINLKPLKEDHDNDWDALRELADKLSCPNATF